MLPVHPRPRLRSVLLNTAAVVLAAMAVLPIEASQPLVEVEPQMQARIDQAIEKGIKYLSALQADSGTWSAQRGAEPGGHHPVGYAALPGLTLLECGVPAHDPRIQKAAEFVRSHGPNLYQTYEASLAILFLDRLGNPDDKELIRTLALRLIAGQKPNGGWTYLCDRFSADEYDKLLTSLQILTPKHSDLLATMQRMEKTHAGVGPLPTMQREKPPETPATATPGGRKLDQSPPLSLLADQILATGYQKPIEPNQVKPELPPDIPERIKKLPVLGDPEKLKRDMKNYKGPTDNSNTQFAILALLVAARRADVPIDRSMALVFMRFDNSQNKDGSWGYHYRHGGEERETPNSEPMTGVGLLGMAVGHGLAYEVYGRGKDASKLLLDDPKIKKGFKALGKHLVQTKDGKDLNKDAVMRNLYYLWTVERVAVLFNQRTIENKDWYRWGAEFLLNTQQTDGNWTEGKYHDARDMVDTCLALLFLKRSNLARELTERLPSFQLDERKK